MLPERIEEHLTSISKHPDACDENTRFGLITLRYGQSYYKAVSQWCDETLEILAACSDSNTEIKIEEERK